MSRPARLVASTKDPGVANFSPGSCVKVYTQSTALLLGRNQMREIFIRALGVVFFATVSPLTVIALWKSRAYHD